MATPDKLESDAAKAASAKSRLAKTTAKKASKRFGMKEIAEGLANPVIQGAAHGQDVLGGTQIGESAVRLLTGKGNPWDALTVALSANPFAGLTGVGTAARGAALAARIADSSIARALAKSALKKPTISVVTPRDKTAWINYSGGFKNQLEVEPNNVNNLQRKMVESDLFGIPENAPPSARPFYGALVNKTKLSPKVIEKIPGVTGDFLRSTNPYTNASIFFGRQNPSVHYLRGEDLSGTYTIGDSWAPATRNGSAIVNQLNDPNVKAQAKDIVNVIRDLRKQKDSLPYVEAQINAIHAIPENIRKVESPIGASDLWAAKGSKDAASKEVQARLNALNNYLKVNFPNATQASLLKLIPKAERTIYKNWIKESLARQELAKFELSPTPYNWD